MATNMVMDKKIFKDPIYMQFYTALSFMLKTEWKRKQTLLGDESGISKGYMADIAKCRRKASFEKRKSIAKTCGYEYIDFLQYGKDLIERNTVEHSKTEKSRLKKQLSSSDIVEPPIGNVIRVYNNIIEKAGIELDEEGQEKLFKLIKRRLKYHSWKDTETEIIDIISLAEKRDAG